MADSVCRPGAAAETSTVSVAAPTVSVASTASAALGSSLLFLDSNFLNPAASAATLYMPGGMLVTV